ncbi:MAG: T9SS type A sorting domain-containing protein [bacterium]|nr:T9SS type A sorting domain-containing protein [bacterium]
MVKAVTVAAISAFFAGTVAYTQVCNPQTPIQSIYDLGTGLYKTFEGGLYEGGSNTRPPAHEAAGVAIARSIGPLSTNGVPDPSGDVVLISIGVSNMSHEWGAGATDDTSSVKLTFTAKAETLQSQGLINSQLRIIDGAGSGLVAGDWAAFPPDTNGRPWSVPITRLQAAGLTRFQVQIACVKTVNANPTECIAGDGSSTGDAGVLTAYYADIARNLMTVFPNIKLAYFVSRIYAGYTTNPLNPEPYAYESGFAVKWVVTSQINRTNEFGDLNFDPDADRVVAPWLAWGAYLWANGETPNGLGISWSIGDYRADLTHPSTGAVDKVGTAFLEFFLNDSTTQPWFCADACAPAEIPVPATDALSPNYPNPFNPMTIIEYSTVEDGHVELYIYDVRGRHVLTLVRGPRAASTYRVPWNGTNESGNPVGTGLYFYRLITDHSDISRKMILVR